jgi:hypothetical protein
MNFWISPFVIEKLRRDVQSQRERALEQKIEGRLERNLPIEGKEQVLDREVEREILFLIAVEKARAFDEEPSERLVRAEEIREFPAAASCSLDRRSRDRR